MNKQVLVSITLALLIGLFLFAGDLVSAQPAAAAGTAKLTFTPVADSYVSQTKPKRNYGSGSALRVDGSPVLRSYLLFDIQGLSGPIETAKLRLFANDSSTTGFDLDTVTDNSWQETSLTYKNAPPIGSVAATSQPFSANTWVSIDVTALISGNGKWALALTSRDNKSIGFASRESGAHAPQLIIVTSDGTPTSTLTNTPVPPTYTSTPTSTTTSTNIYYVSTTGSDSNPGTQAKPWQTIQKAANTMLAGQTAIVLAGDYSGQRVQVTRPGVPGAMITYQAQGTVTMKGFTVKANYIAILGFDISNTDDNWQEGWGIFVQASYCDIENNYVHFATRGGIELFATPANPTFTTNCTVRNNQLYGNSQMGIDVNGRNNLVEGNEIWGTIQYHPQWINPPDWIDADGIRFFGRGHIIRRNYIHDIKYGIPENINPHIDCFQTWSDSYHEDAHDVLFDQNICDNLQTHARGENGQGFMINSPGTCSNLTIRNNLIRAFRNINAYDCDNLSIVNNTFVGDLSFTQWDPFGIGLARSHYAFIKNNIFYNVGGGGAGDFSIDSASQLTINIGYGCVFWNNGQTLPGSPYPHDLWAVDPEFINPAGLDYHLKPGSPCIDAGMTLGEVKNDLDSNPRPLGGGFDVGAYEFIP